MFMSRSLFSDTTIGYGLENDQIGFDFFNDEMWMPLFFDVDAMGYIHIPDFYKKRIAVYDQDGKLIKIIGVDEAISPRMNYFKLNPDESYITYNDYSLFHVSKKGEVLWKYHFGLGVIPETIYSNNSNVYFTLNDQSYYIGYGSSDVNVEKNIMVSKDGQSLIYMSDIKEIYVTNEKYKDIVITEEDSTKKIPVPTNFNSGSSFWVTIGLNNNFYTILINDNKTFTITKIKGATL